MKKIVEKKRRNENQTKKIKITDETHSLLLQRKAQAKKTRFKFTSFIYSLVFCFGLILFFQFHPNSNEEFQPEEVENLKKETDFYFFDQFGEKYNLFEENIHGVSKTWEYLYEDLAEETIEALKEKDDHSAAMMENIGNYESGKVENFFNEVRENITAISEKVTGHERKKGEENSE
jgi:hypothetical protein